MEIKKFNEEWYGGKLKSGTPIKYQGRLQERPVVTSSIEKIFDTIGFDVSSEGIINPTNKFAKMICKMGVREGHFEDIGDGKFKLKN